MESARLALVFALSACGGKLVSEPATPAAGAPTAAGIEESEGQLANEKPSAESSSEAASADAAQVPSEQAAPVVCVGLAGLAELEVTPLPFDGSVGPSEVGPVSSDTGWRIGAAVGIEGWDGVLYGKFGYGIGQYREYGFDAWIEVVERVGDEPDDFQPSKRVPLPNKAKKPYEEIDATPFIADKNGDGKPELWLHYVLRGAERARKGTLEFEDSALTVLSIPELEVLLHLEAGKVERQRRKDESLASESKCVVSISTIDVDCDGAGDVVIDEACERATCKGDLDEETCTRQPAKSKRSVALWQPDQGKFVVR